jgi:Uma2 family endonuclease
MAQVIGSETKQWTAEDLFRRFGPISLGRIVFDPVPGTATVEDVIAFDDHKDQLCELYDGMLVRKPMGFYESFLAVQITIVLGQFVKEHDLGIVAGSDGTMQLFPDAVRIPDVSFTSYQRLANSGFPQAAAPSMAPDLAVEVISRSNTRQEMDQKLKEYFEAGTRAVWYVYPKTRRVVAYTSPESFTELSESDILDAGEVLPGFTLDLKSLFATPDPASDQPK